MGAIRSEWVGGIVGIRTLTVPPEGGMTGFADGIQIYNDLSPELRDRFSELEILYHPALMFMDLRFGRPAFEVVRLHQSRRDMIAGMKDAPRSIHPAIWQRPSGEFVMHVSPWQADGIVAMETPEGDALLEELCQEILAVMRPYAHPWKPGEMLVWDNWRLLHSALGHDSAHPRHMHRTTIEGDYGFGRFEPGGDHAVSVPVMD